MRNLTLAHRTFNPYNDVFAVSRGRCSMTPHVRPQRSCSVIFSIGVALICTGLIDRATLAMDPESIAWRDDYGSALEEAKAANRFLWIQFTGPWCPNCTRMEHDSFPHPSIIEHARQSFVPLKLQSDIHEQLALQFNLSGLPATVLVAPNREIVAVHQGYLGPDDFDAFLKDALARHPEVATPRQIATRSKSTARSIHEGEPSPKKETQVALSGFCPVSLISGHKLVRGQVEYTVQHEGRIYRFADRVMVELFRKEPHRYIPLNGGSCPVTRLDKGTDRPGEPKWGVLYRNQLFLCATEADRRLFLNDPGRYSMVDVAEQGFCAHCIEESGLLVRGDPRHEISRDGRRYWFPDVAHREAFVASRR
jgi:YHS domain-containing protein/thioredoxin-related protein